THMPSGYGKKCRLLSLLIGIAIVACDEHTKTMMNVGDHTLCRRDVEAATRPHGHFAHIGSLLGPTGHHRTHQVAGLKPFHSLTLLGTGAREAEPIHATHLPTAMPCRDDVEGHALLEKQRGGR